ncbi:hypothetical protein NW761_002211 [Fusarium oxysporum]|nr:hypothetical protein NW763_006191 [Fusarium oxysporum]KAJ4060157.1 hypothetical protein NW758_000707 [Fusarium oxysporum]KAJ4063145.1 hypothetical protein NW753_004608 [Fusarium oxysporum]KAJ4103418.1 hypothetical protein NW761_002211 [Fusarium oxysporum]KAJ4104893.1 hypothetical protein NW756_000659 [Fusarium oxysporum]
MARRIHGAARLLNTLIGKLCYDSALLVQPSSKDAVPGLSRSPKWALRHQEQCCVRAFWLRLFHPLGNAAFQVERRTRLDPATSDWKPSPAQHCLLFARGI